MRNDYALDTYLREQAKARKPEPAPEPVKITTGTYPWHAPKLINPLSATTKSL